MKKKIIFFGNNNWGIHVLDYLMARGYEILMVVVPPGTAVEKAMRIRKILPKEAIIVEGFGTSMLTKIIKSYGESLILACSYTAIIPKDIVALGVVNIHGAILPQHRGAHMLNWAIINGWKETGITLHYMEETLDSGNIIANITYPIYSYETINDVKMTMIAKTTELLDKSLPVLMGGKVKGSKQDHAYAKYYPKRRPEDGRIDWSKNAVGIYNLVRALVSPYPGAFCYNKTGAKVTIEKAYVEIDNRPHSKPGRIVKIYDKGIAVTTGYNLLVIEKIREMEFSEYRFFMHEGDYYG